VTLEVTVVARGRTCLGLIQLNETTCAQEERCEECAASDYSAEMQGDLAKAVAVLFFRREECSSRSPASPTSPAP
jgi:hypothetical protein